MRRISFPWKIVLALILLVLMAMAIIVSRINATPGFRKLELPPDDQLSIVFVGDTLLGDAAQPRLNNLGYGWPLEHLRGLIEGDFAIANLEAPITTETKPWDPRQRWSYNSHPAAARALAEVGITAFGLANNHAFDRGRKGLADTLEHAQRAKIRTLGAGIRLRGAQQSLILHHPTATVGIVAMGEARPRTSAGYLRPGIVDLDVESIRKGFKLAREAGAEKVVAFVHWGQNYSGVNARQRAWAREFARAGYDLVIGHGPHIVQPIEVVGDMPVAYSIGNFVFGTPGRFRAEFPGFGLILTADFSRTAPGQLTMRCIVTDNEVVGFQPRECHTEDAGEVLASLNSEVRMEGNIGVLTCSCLSSRP